MKPRLTGDIRIQNNAEFETALMCVEKLMQVAEDSPSDSLDPLIEMLFNAIQAYEAKAPNAVTRDALAESENVGSLERISSIDETLGLDARAAARLELIAAAKRKGINIGLLEAHDGIKLIERVRTWFASEAMLNWYLHEPLIAFGDLTPVEVIKRHGDLGFKQLMEYIEAKERGGFE